MYELARKNPQLTKLVKIGTTLKGREILALKVTQGARGQRDGSRPAVLFSATQHAREWIATEIDRRLMYHYVERWPQRQGDQGAAQDDRAVVRPGHEPGRLPVLVHRTSGCGARTCATTTATTRSRTPTASTRTATTPSTSSTTRRAPRRSSRARPTAAPARRPSARRRRSWACRSASASSSTSTTTPTAAGCCTRRAGRPARRRPTTRSTSRCRATSTGRRSRASIRA